ncbi:MAG TPA: type VI secretion system baseplate subunit TssF, partial [Planctomycetota bacterium]|nr:type VI secretion system baseplate subunit TssF [Planctomycetota bacterium]
GDVASALNMGPETSEDPHVERLLMGFSFLTARIRHKLDDDFPELAHALLNVLYPHYLAPIPSMAIAGFELDPERTDLVEGYSIPAGSLVETAPIADEPCYFRTAYPLRLFPIAVHEASVRRRPFDRPDAPPDARAAIDLELRTVAPDVGFGDLAGSLDKLRFYLHGDRPLANAIYEHLFVDLAGIEIDAGGAPRRIDVSHVREVGFEIDEGILPISSRAQPAFRLLTEYFVFPEKFSYFDLLLPRGLLEGAGPVLRLRLYLRELEREVERNLSAESFRLGCTPIVNLFRRQAESIRTSHTRSEQPVVPDHRRRQALEIYSIDRVILEADGEERECAPYFSTRHGGPRERTIYWHASRRPSSLRVDGVDRGTEVYLSLVDEAYSPQTSDTATIHVETTCLNRDLPNELPFGGGEPRLQLVDAAPEIARAACLTRPTPTVRRMARGEWSWRLISHLAIDHLSLASGEEASSEMLRELLSLYDAVSSNESRAKIESIRKLKVSRTTARLRSVASTAGIPAVCRGLEVELDCDRSRFGDNGLVLFATVLSHFFGRYASVNSFTRTVARWTDNAKAREKAWHPRCGERALL